MSLRTPADVKALRFQERRELARGELWINSEERARAALAWRSFITFSNTVVVPALGAFVGAAIVFAAQTIAGVDRSTAAVFLVAFPVMWAAIGAVMWPSRRGKAEQMAQEARALLAEKGKDPVG